MCKAKDPESIEWSFEEGAYTTLCRPCFDQIVKEYREQDEEEGKIESQEDYENWASEMMGENGYILEETITYL